MSQMRHEIELSVWQSAVIVLNDRPIVIRKMPDTCPGDGASRTRIAVEVDPAAIGVVVRRGPSLEVASA